MPRNNKRALLEYGMDELEELHRQLKEAVADSDIIPPEKAKEMLALVGIAMERVRWNEGSHSDMEETPLHASEENAYDAATLAEASSEYAPSVFDAMLKHMPVGHIAGLCDAVRTVRDAVDRVKFSMGPHVAPDAFMTLPSGRMTYWMRFRQMERILEDRLNE